MPFCSKCGSDVIEGARFCPACGSTMPVAAPAPTDPYLGRKLDGKYLIEELLGVGGMGRVYKATQLSLDKLVCVKVLRVGMMQDETLARRFHREARAASRLNHPNSIQVTDFGQAAEDGALYMAMEFVPGKDLGKIIAQEFPLGEARIVHLMDQVLSALADAHAAGIVHRDLKPENIMVADLRGTKDFVKVLDFGIAKIQETTADPGLTQAGMVCGTPEYMSPEQARGEELDARSDLYAAGVILYQMVTGRLPFTAPTAMGIVTKHLIEPPVPPGQLAGVQVSAGMEAVVLKCMSKDRNGRQATAVALQQELAACLAPKVAPAQQPPEGRELFEDVAVGPRTPGPTRLRPAGEQAKGGTEDVRSAPRPARPPAPAAPAKSGQGWLWGLLIGLVVLGAGGAAVYFLVLRDQPGEAADAGSEIALPQPADAGVAPVDPGPAQAAISDAARMHFQAGKELMARRQYSKAVPAFQRALKASPDFAEAYKALGTCYVSTGQIDQAKQAYRDYLQKKPDAADRAEIQQMIDSF